MKHFQFTRIALAVILLLGARGTSAGELPGDWDVRIDTNAAARAPAAAGWVMQRVQSAVASVESEPVTKPARATARRSRVLQGDARVLAPGTGDANVWLTAAYARRAETPRIPGSVAASIAAARFNLAAAKDGGLAGSLRLETSSQAEAAQAAEALHGLARMLCEVHHGAPAVTALRRSLAIELDGAILTARFAIPRSELPAATAAR